MRIQGRGYKKGRVMIRWVVWERVRGVEGRSKEGLVKYYERRFFMNTSFKL